MTQSSASHGIKSKLKMLSEPKTFSNNGVDGNWMEQLKVK